ncbi:jg13084 [Pararge aegeria aegeria]|uniref:Jg13084 protein n=1 Tax=Pararge aegeria aegeria TaxID=348720 RepID=A0A8S4RN35_9NEOP|nr:jg13084 [Pararge aegeria aegeria]
MKIDYVDLILIHTPRNVMGVQNYDTFEIWKGLEEAKQLGLTRSIGVSNFNSTDMARILANSTTLPAVNQIETNPTFANQELVAYCQSKSIVVMGYSSFGFLVPRPFNDLSLPPSFEDPTLVGMAEKYGVTVSQVVQRYLVDRYIIPIAGSLNKEHIQSNINIYNFSLCHEDVLIINQFDRNVKVYLIDYEGLFNYMHLAFLKLIEFVECNNLRQYELKS